MNTFPTILSWNPQYNFSKMRGEDQRPFGTFPKIHRFGNVGYPLQYYTSQLWLEKSCWRYYTSSRMPSLTWLSPWHLTRPMDCSCSRADWPWKNCVHPIHVTPIFSILIITLTTIIRVLFSDNIILMTILCLIIIFQVPLQLCISHFQLCNKTNTPLGRI